MVALGGDYREVECRGQWYDVGIGSGGMDMSVESAWRELFIIFAKTFDFI